METAPIQIESTYIHSDEVLSAIYKRASAKFIQSAGTRIVFSDVADYVTKQLMWKKQCLYTHSLPILKEVCQRIGESFEDGCAFACPDAKCYRDLYFNIID